jgi:hypothetical protein
VASQLVASRVVLSSIELVRFDDDLGLEDNDKYLDSSAVTLNKCGICLQLVSICVS